jgi:pimeloyl-ACP methyl ester carboxylesterase
MAEVGGTSIEVGGFVTHVLESGRDNAVRGTVLLLHGGAWGECAATAWRSTLERLGEHRHVVAPDLLGFGRSAKIRDFTDPLGLMSRHTGALVAALGLPDVDVVGLSMGGSVALHALTRQPPLVAARTLTLVSAGGAPIAPEVRARLGQWDGTVDGMREQVRLAFADPALAEDDAFVTERVEAALEPGAYEAFAALGLRGPRPPAPPPAPDPARLDLPVLVVAGGRDAVKPPGWADGLVAALPDGRLETEPGSGHCPQIEAPDWFVDTLVGFLDDAAAAADRTAADRTGTPA